LPLSGFSLPFGKGIPVSRHESSYLILMFDVDLYRCAIRRLPLLDFFAMAALPVLDQFSAQRLSILPPPNTSENEGG
jgi:hypothetical protein